MIGLNFLIRLALILIYGAVFLAVLYTVMFGLTWAGRIFIDQTSITMVEHLAWLHSKMPRITWPGKAGGGK